MVAGLIVLVADGSMDNYITVNPHISYYLFAYKRHTKFAFETKVIDFNRTLTIKENAADNIYNCYISPTAGDLLSKLYLVFTVPAIYSSDRYRFRWINNYGTLLIRRATFYVGPTIIDTITGEYLLVMNELEVMLKDNYNNLTGNIDVMCNPQTPIPVVKVVNNNFQTIRYPEAVKNESNNPSIPRREIIVPLTFNFTKHPSLALLLARLQNRKDIYIKLELENIENLYKVYSPELDLYISPSYHNELYPDDKISINNFINDDDTNINAYIEGTFIYLDIYERSLLMITPIKSIIMENNFISSKVEVTPGTDLSTYITLMGTNFHNKEIIWVVRRNDYNKFNDNMNFTDSIPEDLTKPIISYANIYFNDSRIMEDKNENFFNMIQPYQFHSCIPKKGIYCYSFALYPEKSQPTGSYNGAKVITKLKVYSKNPSNNLYINNKLTEAGMITYSYSYLLNYYVKYYNVLEYVGANVAYKYA